MKIYNNILDLIGSTPLVRINSINNGFANIYAKTEFFNPAGSIKDRVALKMILEAEKQGLIKPNKSKIIEPTSGNTGIGLALVCAVLGYELILTMPDTMSRERCAILKAYGAKLILTPGEKGMQGAIDEAEKIKKENPFSFIPQQFDNPSNPKAHYETTAKEIWEDTEGKVDIVIAGVGTGGTISGIGKFLKEKNKDIEIIAVEPYSSPMITKGVFGPHKIQGIGANFIPKNYNPKYIDKVITVKDEDAINLTKKLAKKEGILAGISSGASMFCAIELSKNIKNKDKNIVAILPDTGSRYLSENIF